MASSKECRDFILEQLSEVLDVTCRPMMGEFLFYSSGVLFGGVYDNRLLVKIVPENAHYNMPKSTPYVGAKPMYLVEDLDDKDRLAKIIKATIKGLSNKKRQKTASFNSDGLAEAN